MTAPWRVVSLASDQAVVTLAFRDEGAGDVQNVLREALAASSWDEVQTILADALVDRPHELTKDCWCQPAVEVVSR